MTIFQLIALGIIFFVSYWILIGSKRSHSLVVSSNSDPPKEIIPTPAKAILESNPSTEPEVPDKTVINAKDLKDSQDQPKNEIITKITEEFPEKEEPLKPAKIESPPQATKQSNEYQVYKASYKFLARSARELSVSVGDRVAAVDKSGGWVRAKVACILFSFEFRTWKTHCLDVFDITM